MAIAIYFAAATWPGLWTHFAPDDMHNMYTYWEPGPLKVAWANVLFATSFYRPLAGIFYMPLYRLFGFNPLPYRIVIYAVLWISLWLLYCLARRLTGSREAAGFAVLIGCVNPNLTLVYSSTSMIYDVLCFPFLIGALLYYVRAREGERMLKLRRIGVLAVLFALALNAKEMAVVVPAWLVVYEVLYHGWRKPSWREIAPVVVVGAMAVVYTAGKMLGPDSLASIEGYRPVYTIDRFLETSRIYAGDVFLSQPFDTAQVLLFWVGLFCLAALLRRKAMLFGAAFALIAFLPLNFSPPRDPFVLYIPLAGLAIFAGDLVFAALQFIAARFRLTDSVRRESAALCFAAFLSALAIFNIPRVHEQIAGTVKAEDLTWRVLQQFERVHPRAKPAARVLLVDSPVRDDWDIYFIAKLYFRDRGLKAAWTRPAKSPIIYGDIHDGFDHELRFDGEQLRQVR